MKRLTTEQIRDLMRPVLMRYTPHQLKLTPMDRLLDELAARFDHADVLEFTLPGAPPQAQAMDPERAAAIRRTELRSAGFEKALREAVRAILAVAEVRQH